MSASAVTTHMTSALDQLSSEIAMNQVSHSATPSQSASLQPPQSKSIQLNPIYASQMPTYTATEIHTTNPSNTLSTISNQPVGPHQYSAPISTSPLNPVPTLSATTAPSETTGLSQAPNAFASAVTKSHVHGDNQPILHSTQMTGNQPQSQSSLLNAVTNYSSQPIPTFHTGPSMLNATPPAPVLTTTGATITNFTTAAPHTFSTTAASQMKYASMPFTEATQGSNQPTFSTGNVNTATQSYVTTGTQQTTYSATPTVAQLGQTQSYPGYAPVQTTSMGGQSLPTRYAKPVQYSPNTQGQSVYSHTAQTFTQPHDMGQFNVTHSAPITIFENTYKPENSDPVHPGGQLRGGMRAIYDMNEVPTFEAHPIFQPSAAVLTVAEREALPSEGGERSEAGAPDQRQGSRTQNRPLQKNRMCC